MCGIAGFVSAKLDFDRRAVLGRMTDALTHRGPDARGLFLADEVGVALGHRRLSILDLSEAGAQPMRSESGRFVVAYNGEIYNASALSRELAALGAAFRGHSDTEVLLAAIEQWGLEQALERSFGMFAFALWDSQERLLHLARDRVGIKPLYYALHAGSLAFASELKALRAFPAFEPRVDRAALALLMRHGYIGAPRTIYEQVYKLPAGTVLSVPAAAVLKDALEPKAYWSAREVFERGFGAESSLPEQEQLDLLDALLSEVVGSHLMSDVPLGGFLSGGVDSSLVVSLMQRRASRRVQSFSIGFSEQAFDEAPHAAKVAEHLGTEHTSLYVTAGQAQAVIQNLPDLYDEPFADSSQIPTYLLCKLTREHVTVALSGDGGDELFGGYYRYATAARMWGKLSRVPRASRYALGHALVALAPGAERSWALGLVARAASSLSGRLGHPPERLAELLGAVSPEGLYRSLVASTHGRSLILGANLPTTPYDVRLREPGGLLAHMRLTDIEAYLPDDILVKVDRASMAVSLEARVPLLDHQVLEFAAALPEAFLLREGQGKYPLRRLLARYVPPALTDRAKMGFGIPLAAWLRGPLKAWAEELLSPVRLAREGYLDVGRVQALWAEHQSQRFDHERALWSVLMFQAWRQRWG